MFLRPNFTRPAHFPPPGAALTHAGAWGAPGNADDAKVVHNAPRGVFEWHFTSTARSGLMSLMPLHMVATSGDGVRLLDDAVISCIDDEQVRTMLRESRRVRV